MNAVSAIPERVHLVGVGGIHMSGIARILRARGHTVTGSDLHLSPLTGELALNVTTDGPNPLFLGFLGVLSGGSVLYGWIRRRRAQSTD